MKRPDFTPAEEKLIDHIRNHETSNARVWLFYGPMVSIAILLFALGVNGRHIESELTGFALVTFFLLRFVAYQTKPGWRLKPIVDKYEEALREVTANQASEATSEPARSAASSSPQG